MDGRYCLQCAHGWLGPGTTKRHRPHPSTSRRMFLQKPFLKLVINTIIVDFASSALALSCTRLHRWIRNLPCRGPTLAPCTIHPVMRNCDGNQDERSAQCLGFSVCRPRSLKPTLWPEIWGLRGDGYTLRKLWGCVCWRTFHSLVK